MFHSMLKFTAALLVAALFVGGANPAAAQYPPPDGANASCATQIEERLANELPQARTQALAVFVNQRVRNILNVGNSPSTRYDQAGLPIVEIGQTQAYLPLLIAAPGAFANITEVLGVEETDFTWVARVTRGGVIITRFPVNMFPPGSYYLTVCGARILRFEIPEAYAPVPPANQ